MCVAFWTLEHPEYALILAANRDEFLSRPTIPAAWHNFDSEASADNLNILSGRDVIAGGTWLGINKSGDVAVLTNITELAGKFESSRGELASTFLQRSPSDSFKTEALSTNAPEHLCSYITSVLNNQRKYAGFNLLILSPRHNSDGGIQYEGAMVTNSGGGRDIAARFLTKAESICGGVSNADDSAHAPDQVVSGNDWPKVAQGKGFLQDIVNRDSWEEDELVDALCDMMSVESKIPPTSRYGLRNTISVLPLPVEINSWSKSITPQPLPASKHAAPALQAQITDYYATRLTTIILVRRDGRAVFVERDIWQCQGVVTEPVKADKLSQRHFSFRIES